MSKTTAPLSPRVPSAVGGGAVGTFACWLLGVYVFGADNSAAAATDAIAAVPWPILGVVIGGLTALAGWLPKDLASQLFEASEDTAAYGSPTGSVAPAETAVEDSSLDDAINAGQVNTDEPAPATAED